ncbi:MAG: hypothetical protein ACI9YM_001063 [Brevundimonas sp.]|jgi:hypothetical protein
MESAMTAPDRKALIAAYKRCPTIAGVYAVIWTATGDTWVGRSRHIDTQKNGLWFALRHGTSPHRSLQEAWNSGTEADFRFEQLDRLPEDTSPSLRDLELRERAGRWIARLAARSL